MLYLQSWGGGAEARRGSTGVMTAWP